MANPVRNPFVSGRDGDATLSARPAGLDTRIVRATDALSLWLGRSPTVGELHARLPDLPEEQLLAALYAAHAARRTAGLS